jgi:hypothetical protein
MPAAVRICRALAALMLAGCLALGACALESGHRTADPALLKGGAALLP